MNPIPEEIKSEIWENFQKMQEIQIATIDNDKPRLRPITLIFHNEKFWILTGTDSAKTKQIQENPNIEFCHLLKKDPDTGYIRANGIAKIIQDRDTKEELANQVDYFKSYWKGVDDPNYTLLEIEITEIEYMKPGEYAGQRYLI